MSFEMPKYYAPDFSQEQFVNAPDVKWEEAPKDGVAPDYYHSTSMYPEYFKINGKWTLAEESRMDSSVVICDDGHLAVVENRNLKKGDKVILGTAPAFRSPASIWTTSSSSVREEAARLPMLEITTVCLSF